MHEASVEKAYLLTSLVDIHISDAENFLSSYLFSVCVSALYSKNKKLANFFLKTLSRLQTNTSLFIKVLPVGREHLK